MWADSNHGRYRANVPQLHCQGGPLELLQILLVLRQWHHKKMWWNIGWESMCLAIVLLQLLPFAASSSTWRRRVWWRYKAVHIQILLGQQWLKSLSSEIEAIILLRGSQDKLAISNLRLNEIAGKWIWNLDMPSRTGIQSTVEICTMYQTKLSRVKLFWAVTMEMGHKWMFQVCHQTPFLEIWLLLLALVFG